MTRLLLVLTCFLWTIGHARADDVLHFGAQPAWVTPVDAPPAKPADGAQAADMLRRLSGRTHEVLSAVWCLDKEQEMQAFSITPVEFAALDADRIDAYVGSGEWQGKAGAYAIQGRAEAFVVRLSGSYSGVMGLPLHETATLLRRFGIAA